MIKKIISCGENGAGRAAIDAAIRLDIPYGGWIAPENRSQIEGLPDPCQLREIDGGKRIDAARQNVIDSDATLLMSHGDLAGFTEQIRAVALEVNRHWLHVDLKAAGGFTAAQSLNRWVLEQGIEVLHVAGTSADRDSRIYASTCDILEAFFYLHIMETEMPADLAAVAGTAGITALPRTVDQAVSILDARMTLKDKTTLANMTEKELPALDATLGEYIRNEFELWTRNDALLEACRQESLKMGLGAEGLEMIIIHRLWTTLRRTHVLRVVK